MSRPGKKNELPSLNQLVSGLAQMRDEHMEYLREAIPTDRIPTDAEDHLVVASLRRSLDNVSGFLAMVDQRNVFCGMPIIRFQLDTAMRLHARKLVADIGDYVKYILEGQKASDYVGSDGGKLTDSRLHKSLTKQHESSSDIYKATSGYVHFSNQHLMRVLDLESPDPDAGFLFKDPEEMTVGWSDGEFRGALISIMWATEAVLGECKDWLATKRERQIKSG